MASVHSLQVFKAFKAMHCDPDPALFDDAGRRNATSARALMMFHNDLTCSLLFSTTACESLSVCASTPEGPGAA